MDRSAKQSKSYAVRIHGRIAGRVSARHLREAERLALKRFGPDARVNLS